MLILGHDGKEIEVPDNKLIKVMSPPVVKPNKFITGVVVTCHNYGRFLKQCLDSLVYQTKPFDKIIVVDDSSTDNTKDIVELYDGTIEYLYCNVLDANKARRLGVEMLGREYKYLMFVDADNFISSDFHQKLFDILEQNNSLAIAYAKIKYFKNETHEFFKELCKEFNHYTLRHTNFADLMSLIRMEAYIQSGGIQNFYKSDWNMWLRITSLGWGMKLCKEAILFYRVHGANGHLTRNKEKDDKDTHGVLNDSLKVCITTLFSGREWNLDRYVDSLKALDCKKDNIFIIGIDNSCDRFFNNLLHDKLYDSGFNYTVIREDAQVVKDVPADQVTDKRKHRVEHGKLINTHLAYLYAKIKTFVPQGTDLLWSIEDDVVVPPNSLHDFILAFNDDKTLSTLSGCIRSRFEDNLIGSGGKWGKIKAEDVVFFKDTPSQRLTNILATGMFCSIFRIEFFNKLVFQEKPNDANAYRWYDWAIHKNVHLNGGKLALLNTVECIHWTSGGYGLLCNGQTITDIEYENRGESIQSKISDKVFLQRDDKRSNDGNIVLVKVA